MKEGHRRVERQDLHLLGGRIAIEIEQEVRRYRRQMAITFPLVLRMTYRQSLTCHHEDRLLLELALARVQIRISPRTPTDHREMISHEVGEVVGRMRIEIQMHLHHANVRERRIGTLTLLQLVVRQRGVTGIGTGRIIDGRSRGGHEVGAPSGTGIAREMTGIVMTWREGRDCGIGRETCIGGEEPGLAKRMLTRASQRLTRLNQSIHDTWSGPRYLTGERMKYTIPSCDVYEQAILAQDRIIPMDIVHAVSAADSGSLRGVNKLHLMLHKF